MAWMDDLTEVLGRIRDRVGPAVTGIGREGSGVVIGPDRVATNAHNVRSESVTVSFSDGREAEGRLLGVDPDADLGVVEVDTAGAPAVEWSDVAVAPGQVVFALAHPGGGGLRVTFGAVSAVDRAFRGPRGRRVTASFEHTAPLPRGSSGGPVVDAGGRVVGINTHRLAESFYLARPSGPELSDVLAALGRGEARRRARLGVALVPPRAARRLREAVGLPEADGLLVRGVEEGGPADRAGLRRGDLLTAAGGRPLRSLDDLHEVLDAGADTVEIVLLRGSETATVTADLRPPG